MEPYTACDECSTLPLIGNRWKCQTCPNYNLCCKCYTTRKHTEHDFSSIRASSTGRVMQQRSIFQGECKGNGKEPVGLKSKDPPTSKGRINSKYADLMTKLESHLIPPPLPSHNQPVSGSVAASVTTASPTTDRSNQTPSRIKNNFADVLAKLESLPLPGSTRSRSSQINQRPPSPSPPPLTPPPLTPPPSASEVQSLPCSFAATGNTASSDNKDTLSAVSQNHHGVVMVEVRDTDIKVDDHIQVNMDLDLLQLIQESQARWDPALAEVRGKVGKVTEAIGDTIQVTYAESSQAFTLNRAVVTKVTPISEGDQILISSDVELVKEVQEKDGNWVPDITFDLGKNASVVSLVGENQLIVDSGSHTLCLNASLCSLVSHRTMAEDEIVIYESDSDSDSVIGCDSDSETAESVEELKRKLEDLESACSCNICWDNKRSIVFGCGHFACATCAESLTDCHMCRTKISQRITVYE